MRPLTLLFQDDAILVCVKPPNLLSVQPPKNQRHTPQDDLVQRLGREGHRPLWAVHRLDKETTGVIVLARSPEIRDSLMEAFRQRRVKKTYFAVCAGQLKGEGGTWSFPIQDLGASARVSPDGQPATTRYRVLERRGAATVLEVTPETGRHNQIRVHAAHAGFPLVGERKYGRGRDAVIRHKRAALHAWRLSFAHPVTGAALEFEAPIPVDLQNLLDRLGGSDRS